jgi:protein tyrosine phosphatase
VSRVPKLHSEFWEVPLNLQEKCYVSGSQSRNRYKGVLPNEHSRVHLPGPQSYIHANYIKVSVRVIV